MKSTIKALAELILQNVDILDASIQKVDGKEPSVDDPYDAKTDYPFQDPEVAKASSLISSAAMQLLQTVRPPQISLVTDAMSHVTSASLRVASELNVSEILRDAGAKGMHVSDIAGKCNSAPNKLSLILRLLSSRFIFKEVQPDVFAINRLSSLLDKGLSVDELQKPGTQRYDNPKAAGIALIDHLTDTGSKVSAHLFESVSDPEFAMSGEPNRCTLNKAFNYEETNWEFYEEPSHKDLQHRLGIAMEGAQKFEPPNLATSGDAFNWKAFSENDTVIDVGGGIGSVSIQIAEAFPNLKFVVQDRPKYIADGENRCQELKKELWASGRLKFQEHDFFTPQPVKNACVFFLKHVLHDWSDIYAMKILRHLRDAAGPDTKLFVMDRILPYSCLTSPEIDQITVPGYVRCELPSPLSVVGGGDSLPYTLSMMVMQFCNGQERTMGHLIELFWISGWKIEKVFQIDSMARCAAQIRAVPI